MPIDPFSALNAMIRAEVARSAEPGTESTVRREAPGGARRNPAPVHGRGADRAADPGPAREHGGEHRRDLG
ncbi:hypothetical protein ACFYVL_30090 [Streptomyces sp. NPDC004111]|uniref:hypothetical protein n=1 Tax=Streptomyces sp. NPDC004111 TaxID=3364690 RepID=UPI00368D2645